MRKHAQKPPSTIFCGIDMTLDPVQLAADLIRCPSITPEDAGALDLLQGVLEVLGFTCIYPLKKSAQRQSTIFMRGWATLHQFLFCSHTDVVPVGAQDDWQVDPLPARKKTGFYGGAVRPT